ncbi:MAG TPA: Tar ligand binding domain-containing protein, partial [Burkholderiales bacterium]|nr:Tar ligand binding domain-containing protein [Burkholderiales bacterium]
MKDLTIKAKLIALIASSLVALAVLGAATFHGLNTDRTSLESIGTNRLPSIVALFQMRGSATE